MKIGFLLLLLSISFASIGQNTPYFYSIKADLDDEVVYCMEQDAKGRLLLGTNKGLFTYNGFAIERIKMTKAKSKEITCILKEKNTFFASNGVGQLFKLIDNSLQALLLPQFNDQIVRFYFSSDELIIVGKKDIFTYDKEGTTLKFKEQIPFSEPLGTSVKDYVVFENERFALLNSKEIITIDEMESREIPSGTGRNIVNVNNKMIIVPNYSATEKMYSFKGASFRSLGAPFQKNNLKIKQTVIIQNILYLLTDYGVLVYKNGIEKPAERWFEKYAITSVFKDDFGNMWFATRGNGLLYIPAGKHEMILSSSLVSLCEGPENSFYGGTSFGTVLQFYATGKLKLELSNVNVLQEVQHLNYDAVLNCLFASNSVYSFSENLPALTLNESVFSTVRNNFGDLFLAKSNGVFVFPSCSPINFWSKCKDSTFFRQLSTFSATQFAKNPINGQIVFSSQNGLFSINDDYSLKSITHFGKIIDAQQIIWFKGVLYIATIDNKLLEIKDGKVINERFLTKDKKELVVSKMQCDANYIYFLSEKGLFRLNAIHAKMESLKDVIGFDGLSMRDFVLKNEYLFIATQRGVLKVKWLIQHGIKFSLLMGVPFGKRSKEIKKKGEVYYFPANDRHIVIPFECIDLSGNHQFIVEYRLNKSDEIGEWQTMPFTSEQLNLSHLQYGSYTIEMRLIDPISKAKTNIQKVKISVAANIWEQNWFWFLLGSFCMLLFWIFYRSWRRKQFALNGKLQFSSAQ